jgi:hypothetical protein
MAVFLWGIAEVQWKLTPFCPAIANVMQTRYVSWCNNNQQMNKFAPSWSRGNWVKPTA